MNTLYGVELRPKHVYSIVLKLGKSTIHIELFSVVIESGTGRTYLRYYDLDDYLWDDRLYTLYADAVESIRFENSNDLADFWN